MSIQLLAQFLIMYTAHKVLFTFFLLFFVVFSHHRANASHLSGGEVTFKCISGNNYEVYVTLYRDCTGITMGTFQTLYACPTTLVSPATQTLTPLPRPAGTPGDSEGFEDITPLCGGTSSCVSGGAGVGYSKGVFRGNITVLGAPSYSNPISFVTGTCCRPALTNSIEANFRLETRMFYHVMGACDNSSPLFLANQTGFACLNQPFVYNNTAFDPDGDDLRYYLIAPDVGNVTCNDYTAGTFNAPYTVTSPIASSLTPCGILVDSLNGSLSFIPSVAGKFMFAMEVREYRNVIGTGRVLLSSTIRDITLFVTNCPGGGGSPPLITVTRGSTITNIPVTVSCSPIATQELTISTCELMNLQIDVEATGSLAVGTNLIFSLAGEFFDTPVNPTNAYCAISSLNRACATISATYPGAYVPNQGLTSSSAPYKAGCLVTWTPKQGDVGSRIIYITVQYCSSIGSIPFKFTVPYKINVQPNPITLSFVSGGCAGGNTVLQANGTGGSLTPYYSWSFDGGATYSTPSTSPTITHNFPAPGVYQVIVQSQDGFSGQVCSRVTQNVTITVFVPEALLSTSNPPKVCAGQSITYAIPQGSFQPGFSYGFDFNGDNVVDSAFSYLNNISSITHFYNTPGTQVLNYTVTNSAGCTATASQFVTVLPAVDANILTQKDTVCEGSPLFLGNNSNYSTAYEWYFLNPSNQNVLPPRLDTVKAGFSVAFPTAGTYIIKLVAKNEISCADIEIKEVYVIPSPNANVSLSDTVICIGDAVQFNTTNTGNYSWDFSETGFATPIYNVPNPVRAFTAAGTYTIGFTAYSSINSCNRTVYRKVRVLEKPNIGFSASDTMFCASEPVTFNNLLTFNNTNQTYSFNWTFGDGGTSTDINPVHVYQTPGIYVVKLKTNTSYAGKTCSYTDSLVVNALEAPIIRDILSNPDSAVAVPYQNVNFTPVYTSNLTPNTFAWMFGDNSGASSNQENPSHTYLDAGLYPVTLIMQNKFGCKDTFVYQMRVIDVDSLFVPNIVTPNNDSKNDVFKVRFRNLKTYHIEIFNRWGNKVYESDDPKEVWDPIKEEDGVYYYMIACEGRFGTDYNRKGNITIMR